MTADQHRQSGPPASGPRCERWDTAPPIAPAANDDTQAAIAIVVSLLIAAVRVDDAVFVETGVARDRPVRVVAGSMPEADLEWLRAKGHLGTDVDHTCVRFQTRPPRWATFLVLPVPGRAGSILVARRERGTPLPSENRRVAMLIRECLGRVLAAEQVTDAMSTSLVVSEELFRTRLAAELHDDVGQRLSALLIEARRLQNTLDHADTEASRESASWISEQLKECNEVVRDLVYETSAPTLAEFGLAAAVRDLAERRQDRNAITISHSSDVADSDKELSYESLPRSIQVACLRIIQEAVTNVIKHAGAQHCDITLTLSDTLLSVTIEDDGLGSPVTHASGGFGVTGMRERAALLGGRIIINSDPGTGTVVHADLPVPPVDPLSTETPLMRDQANE
jgi:signal transduction histidine kinase